MIILDDELPAPERVTIDPGDTTAGIAPAYVMVRPALALEYYAAREKTRPLIAGLLLGRRSRDALAAVLGPEFGEPRGLDDFAFVQAAAERLALIELTTLCATEWSGFAAKDGSPRELTRANIALLLRTPTYAERVSAVVNRVVNERRAEGNVSAASPSGAAAAAATGAGTAATAANAALSAEQTTPENSARSTSTLQ